MATTAKHFSSLENANGAPFCNATVVAKDGDYSETLKSFAASCNYTGANDRRGTYVVTASFQGIAAPAQTVTVSDESTGCHVVGEHLAFDLGTIDAGAGGED